MTESLAGDVAPAVPARRRRIPAGVWIEPSPRRVRAYAAGIKVADSTRALLVWERGPLPAYWFPVEDTNSAHLTADGGVSSSGSRFWTLRAGDRLVDKAAHSVPDAAGDLAALAGHVALYWDRMDAWYEEDDEVFVHPRDPYHRVDVLNSSRHLRVVIGGLTVADSSRPRLLFETGLPTRYYVPKQDVRWDLLEPTETTTRCPYKGVASYWTARAGGAEETDVAWCYPAPIPECTKIENLVCFFNERVDLIVDGVILERPVTPWSTPPRGAVAPTAAPQS